MPSESFRSIEALCWNEEHVPEANLLQQLETALAADPDVTNEKGDYGRTLLHRAASYRPVAFCKVLAERNIDAVRTLNDFGYPPFHDSCSGNNIEAAKYLFGLYPESINIADDLRSYPIHILLEYGENDILELTRFLLKHDRGAVSTHNDPGDLPLHMVSRWHDNLNIVKLVFNAYPEAIYAQNKQGRTPLDLARSGRNDVVAHFIESQIQLIRQARMNAEQENNGQLPIHFALQHEDVSLGTIKLLLADSPNSLEVANLEGNYAIHLACLAGDFEIITYILGKSDCGVSVKNADGMLPVQLLLYHANCDRNCQEYVAVIHHLLFAYPAVRDIFMNE